VTTLEAVSIGEILAPGARPAGRQVEDLGPAEIARVMVAIQRMRREKIEDIKSLAIEVAEDATEVRAREYLSAEGPAQQRDQQSRLAAAEANFKADALKATLDAARESLRLLKDDWDTCRSVMANERAERNATEGWGS
jgi:hypothetical protein